MMTGAATLRLCFRSDSLPGRNRQRHRNPQTARRRAFSGDRDGAPWPGSVREAGHNVLVGVLLHGICLGGVFSAIAYGMSAGLSALIVRSWPRRCVGISKAAENDQATSISRPVIGGLAGAVTHMIRGNRAVQPEIVIAGPAAAPCLRASHEAGEPVEEVEGPVSNMGRLDCKEPSLIAHGIFGRTDVGFAEVSDKLARAWRTRAHRTACSFWSRKALSGTIRHDRIPLRRNRVRAYAAIRRIARIGQDRYFHHRLLQCTMPKNRAPARIEEDRG